MSIYPTLPDRFRVQSSATVIPMSSSFTSMFDEKQELRCCAGGMFCSVQLWRTLRRGQVEKSHTLRTLGAKLTP